ncbi:T9SS type A sorting domain-containing protein [Natronogracilivirga saccharolytica]|uniref:T9SS type A sorting domain-containing protein n=1 Tax=Natronogracilivirga saccharolytica TaxID=2812953 RepID=A0A8J7RK73_9BACT|nr:T9SS type A sorting domain-containing protein [Natronogracilivirga saccharolytica]MBP3193240.1 T9SS type A sorting domain-containing protein [Natronogracilivirga saccharolytica]
MRNHFISICKTALCVWVAFFWLLSGQTSAQDATWLNVGSLHNWYSEIGNEREHGLVTSQQYGLRWPAIFEFQDAQATKAFWIGSRGFDDGVNAPFDYKVIHTGPRVLGADHFFPQEFTLYSRFDAPEVFVDGVPTFFEQVIPDEIDPDLPSDRMLRNTVRTSMGVTFTREIHQFSQEHHDNYHIMDYTITNETGQYNDIPEQTLEDLLFYFQFRYSPVRKSRYLVANHTGWGRNTMNDRWGDGLRGQERGEPFSDGGPPMRASYAWHGYEPERRIDYNNIGAPQIDPVTQFMSLADTLGHLLAHHFVGHATIHADAGPGDPSNDMNQPYTLGHINSDDDLKSSNDPFNRARMQREYNIMNRGVMSRHAYQVHSASEFIDFADQESDPRLGTSGGMSAMKAYGPYTLAPGESVRIVWVEGVSGLSVEMAREIGEKYKAYVEDRTSDAQGPRIDGSTGIIDDRAKNEWVMTGRDSLLQTFERAILNYNNDFAIPQPPEPPSIFQVNSGGDGIFLDWQYDGDQGQLEAFEIYRAQQRYDSTAHLVHVADASERSFVDETAIRGRDYYYYISAVGPDQTGDPATGTPAGALRSSRYYTQTFDPARLQRQAGEAMSQIAIAPNPYVRTDDDNLRFTTRDEVAFFDVPGEADISIYTELGELVQTIEHRDGSGDASWDLRTRSRQLVVSGIYIVVFDNLETGERTTRKLVVVM